MSDNGFYRAFEDRHRGSRESILERLKVYLPFVEPLRAIYPESAAVDLGCGRGEWLILMQQVGFSTVGVDIDEGMLSACAGRDLKTVKQDGVTFLKNLADDSQCVVSGFHIAEHLAFADLQVLVQEALRVLKPGGLLILETPNPENVAVGTTNFYLDPTHQRPIPPLLLEFLPEHYGFARIKIMRLQEQPALVGKEGVALIDVFCGASPDYSVVAQKSAAPSIMAVFDEPFARPYGIELGQLANRFDAKLDRRFDALERRISGAENVANQTELALDRFNALHEKLMIEAVRAERNGAKTALIAEQLCGANFRLRAVEGELAAVKDRAGQFEARAVAAENFVGELEVRLEVAERRAEELERRAITAESEAAEQECRAGRAQAFIEDLALRVVEAETRAQGLEVHAVEPDSGASENASSEAVCEIQLDALRHRVVAALMQLQELERRAIAAETRVGELEYQVFEVEGDAEASECRATVAEEKAAEASSQVVELQGRLVDLEARALELERHRAEEKVRASHMEGAVKQLEHRAVDADSRANQMEQRAAAAEAKVDELERTAATAEARLAQETAEVCFLRAQRDELQCELAAAQSSAHRWQVETNQWHERLVSVHRSSSWRMTAPIRAVKRLASGDLSPVRRTVGVLTKSVRSVVRPAAVAVARAALKRPMLRYKLSTTLHRYPSLRQHVTLFVRKAGLVPGAEAYVTHVPPKTYQLPVHESVASMTTIEPDLSNLSVNARRIYRDLHASVERNGRRSV